MMSENTLYMWAKGHRQNWLRYSVFLKGPLITLTSVKLKNFDELLLLILSASVWWEQDNWEGNTKEEDTDTTFKIRYEVVYWTNTSLVSGKNYFPASS